MLNKQSNQIKVILADDHLLMRNILRSLLKPATDIEVVGEASTAEEALLLIKTNRVDILLLDLDMPGVSGLEVTRRLQQQKNAPKIIVLTAHAHEPYPSQLLKAGAAGYITKGCTANELITAIRTTHYEGSYLPKQLAKDLLENTSELKQKANFASLNAREMEIFLLMCRGEPTTSISKKLFLSYKTVVTYRHKIFKKLGIRNNVEMIKLALESGLVEQ
jgi:two-component system invasion response regulator UvrY